MFYILSLVDVLESQALTNGFKGTDVVRAARVHADAAALCNGPVPAHLIAEALTLVVSQAVAR